MAESTSQRELQVHRTLVLSGVSLTSYSVHEDTLSLHLRSALPQRSVTETLNRIAASTKGRGRVPMWFGDIRALVSSESVTSKAKFREHRRNQKRSAETSAMSESARGGSQRRRRLRSAILAMLFAAIVCGPSQAAATSAGVDREYLGVLIAAAAQHAGVHPDVLASVVWVESQGWPWALNVGGVGYYPRTRQEAERLLARVSQDVDIGYGQISYRHWGQVFGLRKADLLDPWTNLVVAALILRYTMELEPGWGGVGRYHSATPHRKLGYAHKVARAYLALQAQRAHTAPVASAQAGRTP